MSGITIYGSPMSESGKGTEVRNWKVLESSRKFLRVLETGHMSQDSEFGETESGDGVGRSPEVREDLGMARNKETIGALMINSPFQCFQLKCQ